ncbi:MAG TPA: aldehyde dehydrogenase family protein [Solirubrobacteraceae bacterium]|nr:aldehyde dehydrogenase family protein [Solirubrobacteraceae bacterium]
MIEVRDPASGALLATLEELGSAEVGELVARAQEAQRDWEALGFDARGEVLSAMRRWLLRESERVIETIVSETGKAYEDAQLLELGYTVSALSYWARTAGRHLGERRFLSRAPLLPGRRIVTRWVPRGVVGVIGPWNYPLLNSFGDAIPALAAGNAVVLKPSELTPLTSLLIADGLRECGLPDGVFSVATGGRATGEALVDSVDFVMFTGSSRSGRAVAARAATRLVPFALELGGKDALIVLEGAPLERAANVAVYYGMMNAGQSCVSIERVYADRAIHDEFVELIAAKVRGLRVGPPHGAGSVDVGAISSERQLAIIEEHVADAVAKGARALVGGRRIAGPGTFFEPTVLVDVDHTMRCMREETFGPTLPVMAVSGADQAVELVNDSPMGLGAAVFAADAQSGEALARRLEVGAVCVNDAAVNYFALAAPMGGVKESGIGVRHGAEGIRKYCRPQTILVSPRAMPAREPQFYPYTKRSARLVRTLLRVLYRR